ncbi:MAG: DNA-deoxyinosine glycosylase [Melioribacteraceae bacterium]|nr:DNA-deoxyinosine glycosylase [Melioribacteraceae bacterium]
MPGERSLAMNEYYAHPQNKFWKIMMNIFSEPETLTYEKRVEVLLKNHVALWDVLENCERSGSLDQNIKGEIPNDFFSFLNEYNTITHILFNGGTVEKLFNKHLLRDADIIYTKLPSTSPAHARMPFETKLKIWRANILSAL